MKRFYAWAQRLRQYISPVFLTMFAVSFTLWYISKLGYTYTTDFEVEVSVDGANIAVPCVVEGKGTTLFGYGLYNSRSAAISASELKHEIVEEKEPQAEGGDTVVVSRKMYISSDSMRDALSVKFSDLKILSVGPLPEIDLQNK